MLFWHGVFVSRDISGSNGSFSPGVVGDYVNALGWTIIHCAASCSRKDKIQRVFWRKIIAWFSNSLCLYLYLSISLSEPLGAWVFSLNKHSQYLAWESNRRSYDRVNAALTRIHCAFTYFVRLT